MSENGDIYTAGKKISLPLAVKAWTISPLYPLQMSARKMGIANIYILEKGTMIHHFVCVGHRILNLKKWSFYRSRELQKRI